MLDTGVKFAAQESAKTPAQQLTEEASAKTAKKAAFEDLEIDMNKLKKIDPVELARPTVGQEVVPCGNVTQDCCSMVKFDTFRKVLSSPDFQSYYSEVSAEVAQGALASGPAIVATGGNITALSPLAGPAAPAVAFVGGAITSRGAYGSNLWSVAKISAKFVSMYTVGGY